MQVYVHAERSCRGHLSGQGNPPMLGPRREVQRPWGVQHCTKPRGCINILTPRITLCAMTLHDVLGDGASERGRGGGRGRGADSERGRERARGLGGRERCWPAPVLVAKPSRPLPAPWAKPSAPPWRESAFDPRHEICLAGS